MGKASLVIGIVSIIVALIPVIGHLVFIPAIIGIVLGIVYINKKDKKKGSAIAGIVLNSIALVLIVIYTIILFFYSFKQGFEKGLYGTRESGDNKIRNEVSESENNSLQGTISKSFGTYIVPKEWSESIQLSSNTKYFYLKDGTNLNRPTSNISIEEATNKYAKENHELFRRAILSQISMQVSKDLNASQVSGSGTNTKNGDIMYIFTIEDENSNITTKHYYIVGDYKHILLIETDFHDENISDISIIARSIADSFEWSK